MILKTTNLGPPDDYKEIGWPGGMSNLFYTIDEGIEDQLRAGRVFTAYAASNFHGLVWLNAEGSFSCQVWVWHSPQATVQAETLEALMREVSDEWGWD